MRLIENPNKYGNRVNAREKSAPTAAPAGRPHP